MKAKKKITITMTGKEKKQLETFAAAIGWSWEEFEQSLNAVVKDRLKESDKQPEFIY